MALGSRSDSVVRIMRHKTYRRSLRHCENVRLSVTENEALGSNLAADGIQLNGPKEQLERRRGIFELQLPLRRQCEVPIAHEVEWWDHDTTPEVTKQSVKEAVDKNSGVNKASRRTRTMHFEVELPVRFTTSATNVGRLRICSLGILTRFAMDENGRDIILDPEAAGGGIREEPMEEVAAIEG
ncbi:hypothetical protein BDQ17DRAFT_1491740 [Cyathus striatus]|nr:hypothetical protein BDQ17DRAFT_1491740 [Cyathus striatus]